MERESYLVLFSSLLRFLSGFWPAGCCGEMDEKLGRQQFLCCWVIVGSNVIKKRQALVGQPEGAYAGA